MATPARRILPREENAGVSYSLDGLHWSEGYANPVVRHGVLAGPVGSFGEVHFHYEHPFRYIYHTLRWLTDSQDKEDIGVQVCCVCLFPESLVHFFSLYVYVITTVTVFEYHR